MKVLIIITILLSVTLHKSHAQDHTQNNLMQENTLENLQEAYDKEVNASSKYQLYALKAYQEGYPQVAKLFAAASTSENIHSLNHKEAIENLGGTPEEPTIKDVDVKSTENNLKESANEETIEWKSMYPQYIEEAQKEQAVDAIESFVFTKNTEKKHECLFREALIHLGKNTPEDTM